jgi:hypothetical protein
MPRRCPPCELTLPDAVTVDGGLRGVRYCIQCGEELER